MKAHPTRVGVFAYKRPDGSEVRELRHPDEVFHADSLASLEDVPVVLGRHPAGGVTPGIFQRETVGHVRAGSVSKAEDGQRVRSEFVLGREDGIAAAEHRTHPELSCGYDCKIDPTPGTFEGERYDQAQTAIRYNHVVMLEPGRGRMGRACRLDAAGEEITEDPTQEIEVMKITINGKTYENEAEAQKAITALEARADAAEAQAKTLTETVARHDAETAKAKRSALEGQVKKVMGETFATSRKDANGAEVALTDRELRVAVIKRADSSFDDKGRDDVYVEARFDATLATSSKAAAVIEALNTPPAKRADSAPANAARELAAKNLEAAKKAGVSVVE